MCVSWHLSSHLTSPIVFFVFVICFAPCHSTDGRIAQLVHLMSCQPIQIRSNVANIHVVPASPLSGLRAFGRLFKRWHGVEGAINTTDAKVTGLHAKEGVMMSISCGAPKLWR